MSMAIWPTSNKSATYVYINIPEGCSFGVVRGQSHCLRLWGHGFEASSRLWIIMGRRNQIKLKLNDLNLCLKALFFKKWGNPGLFLVYFGHFQTKIITIFTTNWWEKMSCPSGIRRRDSNSQRLQHESSPRTTRPGLYFCWFGSQSTKFDFLRRNHLRKSIHWRLESCLQRSLFT